MSTQPRTMPHTFSDPILRAHFAKTPMPPGSARLIDTSPDVFLDTEEEINVIAASLWILAIKYDELEEKDRPKTKEHLRKWILRYLMDTVGKVAGKVEPPFTAWSIDQIEKDVRAMLEELLQKTLPPDDKKVDARDAKK